MYDYDFSMEVWAHAEVYYEYKMTVSFRKDGLTNYGQKTLEQCPRSAL